MSSDPLTGVQGNRSDAAAASDTANVSRQSLVKRLLQKFSFSDNSANSTQKLPTLPAVANAAAPAWTEGRQVPASVDLAGNQRVVLAAGTAVVGKVDQGAPNAGGALAWPVDDGHPDPQTDALTQPQLETELDEKFGDLGLRASAGSAPVVTASDDANLASLKVVGSGAEATAQRVTLATEALAALELIGIKGADGSNEASFDNPLPVSMPTMAAVTALTTPDSSSYGNDGALRGTVLPELVPSSQTGFQNAYLFDGVNRGVDTQAIDCGNSVTGVAGVSGVGTAAKFCLEAKARTGATIPSQEIIAGRVSSGGAGAFQPMIYSFGGKFVVSVHDNTGVERDVVGSTVMTVDTDYVVAAAYDGVTLRLLVNGSVDGSVALTGVEAADATTKFLIGRYDDTNSAVTGGYPWNGLINEVRWSNTERYTGAYTPATTPFTNDSNTLGLWHLDQQSGTIAVTGAFYQATQPVSEPFLTQNRGTWGYNAGTSGTLTLTGGKRVLLISAIAQEASATITINGGDTITLPYGSTDKASSAIEIVPRGNLTNPTIIFTGTKGYFCEYVS